MDRILKRDGREVSFDDGKIISAISKAFAATNTEIKKTSVLELTTAVIHLLEDDFKGKPVTVENIQDAVETVLINSGWGKVAKAYILYREKRSQVRDGRSELMDAVAEIIYENNRDNANVGNSPSAKVLQIAEVASKNYYLQRVIPPEQAKAHQNGDIHIHDISWYGKTLTCLQIPLARLLREGFDNGHGFIRPPKGIKTAAALSAIVLQCNQNDMHGGQSFAYLDRDLAPYVEKEYQRQSKLTSDIVSRIGELAYIDWTEEYIDERVREETFQAMEGLVFNLNSMHSRAGAQVPFSSINLGTDTSRGGRLITECFLKAYERGLGKGETPLWPNTCFKLKRGVNFNPGDPNYDLFKLAMRVSCKRLFPTYSFQDSSFNSGFGDEEVAYMGCRTRVMSNVNGPEVTDGRGNLSFTTVNLARLGITAGKDLSKFWTSLDELLSLCIRQLLTRYDVQKNLKVRDFPFLMGQRLYQNSEHLDLKDSIVDAIKNGTLSIGFVGLAECLVALTGKHHGEDEGSQALGLSIIAHMRKRCDIAVKEHDLNFSLLATPAESTAGRFVKMDVKRFGIIPGVTDKDWYTNSYHIPVQYRISALEKIALEGPYHKYCNAGHISYVELESAPINNLEAFEALLNAMAESDMGYAAINFPVDFCRDCGLNGVFEEDKCPKCGSASISRVRRITGYLSTLDMFNASKRAEVEHRTKHS